MAALHHIWEFPKMRGIKDPTTWGTILGSPPYFRKPPIQESCRTAAKGAAGLEKAPFPVIG